MNFNDLKNGGNVLSATQMKNVKGGGTCGYRVVINGKEYIDCNKSKKHATDRANESGGNWCCDSCNTSSYCS